MNTLLELWVWNFGRLVTFLLHCNARNLVLNILIYDKIWGDNLHSAPTPNSERTLRMTESGKVSTPERSLAAFKKKKENHQSTKQLKINAHRRLQAARSRGWSDIAKTAIRPIHVRLILIKANTLPADRHRNVTSPSGE